MGVKKINGGAEDFINKFVRSRGGDSTELEAAPVIQSISLSINNTTGARFTGKSFDLTSTLSEDGRPGSTKMVEASVRGSLETVYETDTIITNPNTVGPEQRSNQSQNLNSGAGIDMAGDGVNSWMLINQTGASFTTATGRKPSFGGWGNMNITNGGTVDYLYAVEGSKAGTWIATGSQNGNPDSPLILRSTDFGSNWVRTVLSNSVSTYHIKMRYVATDNNGNWVCLGETSEQYGYVVTSYSTDDGVTWSAPAYIANNIEPMGLAAHDGSWVAMTYTPGGTNISGMYRSTDVGATWTYSALPEPYSYLEFAGISVSDEGTWIMGFRRRLVGSSMLENDWVFVSTNGGASWGAVDVGVDGPAQVFYVGGRTWYIQKYGTKDFAVSHDDGVTWQTETSPIASGEVYSGINSYARASGTVVAAPRNPGANFSSYTWFTPNTWTLELSSSDGLSDITQGMSVNNGGSTTGTVRSVDVATSEIVIDGDIFTSAGTWNWGDNVFTDPIITSNSELYLVFNSSGTVTGLSTTPQDPYYSTLNNPVDLTFTFPSTFPSGAAPDTELPAGTSLCAVVTSFNKVGVSQLAAKVTP